MTEQTDPRAGPASHVRRGLFLLLIPLGLTLLLASVVAAADPPDRGTRLRHIAEQVRTPAGMRALSADDLAFLGLRPGTGRCAGMYELLDPSLAPSCTHGYDAVPQPGDRAPAAASVGECDPFVPATCPAPPGWKAPDRIPCYSSGPYVEVLYAYWGTAAGPKYLEQIRRAIAEVDLIFKVSASAVTNSTGTVGNRHVRWAMGTGCKLKITSVSMSSTVEGFDEIKSNLMSRGIIKSTRKYVAFLGNDMCSGGLADVPDDSRPGSSNSANGGGTLGSFDGGCTNDPWLVAHELMHTLGAVSRDAPHSTGNHCWDDVKLSGYGSDVMCYEDGEFGYYPRCKATRPETFDCGKDDYFNPYPKTGNYLATHWNTASNIYLTASEPPAWDLIALPTVSLPATGTKIAGEATIHAVPVAPTGLKLDRVEFTWSGGGSDSADRTPFDATVDTLGFASSAGVTVTATAVDELGGRSKPASATYTVVNPQVHLDTPLGPSQSSPKVKWTASAAAFGGRTVSKVQLLLDDVPVGTADTTAPFGGTAYLSTKLPFPGAYFVELSARVTDSAGAQRTTDVRNIVVGTPTVIPVPPGGIQGAAAGALQRLRAEVRPLVGVPISKVEFLVDGTLVSAGTDTAAPYAVSWTASGNGQRSLTVRVTDGNGFVTTSDPAIFSVVPKVGTVALTSPLDSTIVEPGPVSIGATATPPAGGTLDAIDIHVDDWWVDTLPPGTASKSVALGWLAPGPHYVSVNAYGTTADAGFWSQQSFSRLLIVDGPNVAVTGPTASLVHGKVTVTAAVTDLGGAAVGSVSFYAGGGWIGSDDTAPYSITWDTLLEPDGLGPLTARAETDVGTFESAVRTVTKRNLSAWFGSPAAGATVHGAVKFTANARCDIDCHIEIATFKVDGVAINTDKTGPYIYTWDSTKVADGPHTFAVTFATSDARKVSTSTYAFTVDNP